MFPSIPACFPAPIVPFVLYYLRSVTRLLQRIGNSRQGRAEQPVSIVFLGATVASRVAGAASLLLLFASVQRVGSSSIKY